MAGDRPWLRDPGPGPTALDHVADLRPGPPLVEDQRRLPGGVHEKLHGRARAVREIPSVGKPFGQAPGWIRRLTGAAGRRRAHFNRPSQGRGLASLPSSREEDCLRKPSRQEKDQRSQSIIRYWTASETWTVEMPSLPSRSAIVRATLRTRSKARALKPSLVTAVSRSFSASAGRGQNCLTSFGPIWALAKMRRPAKRSVCSFLARVTRTRMAAELSAGVRETMSRNLTSGTSSWMSMRSRSGPEIFE